MVSLSLGFCSLGAGEVARVGEIVIDEAALQSAIARSGLPLNDPATPRKALEELVTFETLAAEAKELGYDRLPDIQQELKRLLVQRLVLEKVDRQLASAPSSDADLRAYYQAHPAEFKVPGMIRARVLTLNSVEGGDDARARLDRIREEVVGGAKFEEVVRRSSDFANERSDGGVTGWMVEGQESRRYPKPVIEALFALGKPGELTPVVGAGRALFLGQLVELRPGRVPAFETMRDQVAQRVRAFRRQEAYQAWVDGVRAKLGVKVDEAAVTAVAASLQSSVRPPPAPFRAP